MINWTQRLLKGRDFFRRAHDSIGQIRKYTREPYWTHTEWTMERLAWITSDEDLLIGELGHDYWEDVVPNNSDYTMKMVMDLFGGRVVKHISDLTDVFTSVSFHQFNRAQRKAMEAARIAKIAISSKNGKIVDLIHNTESILNYDKEFAKIYLKEKWNLLQVLKDGDKETWNFAFNQVSEGIRSLGLDLPK